MPLGAVLDRYDDFSLALDLKLLDVAAGVNPDKPFTFELTFGFLNLANAAQTNFFRGNGTESPNLAEFAFFPNTGYGPTIWPSVWATNSAFNYNGPTDYTLLDLPVGVLMRVSMAYTASNSTLTTSITTNGVAIGPIHNVTLSPSFTDFRVGAFAVESYSDGGQNPKDPGSLLAHGIADNILLTIPPPPVQNISGRFLSNQWQVTFASRTNWIYKLERGNDLKAWAATTASTNGNGMNLTLVDINPPPGVAYYRVSAQRP
jgi:hypothetical protein